MVVLQPGNGSCLFLQPYNLSILYVCVMKKIKLDFNESPLIVIHTFYWPEELARRVSGKLSWQM